MPKRFNDTGLCIPDKHYMVDTSAKIKQILDYVREGDYFTINRPRQYGKTTTAALLADRLSNDPAYLLIDLSFEELDDKAFSSEEKFFLTFLGMLIDALEFLDAPELAEDLAKDKNSVNTTKLLSKKLSSLARNAKQKIVLMIDEVDQSNNNELFLSFLAMLRNKYLLRNRKQDYTFHSVILIGVHDVKTLKMKINPNSTGQLNSPWNIAIDFDVEMSFRPQEIESMLSDYSQDKGVKMDIPGIAEKIYYYTAGYPYLCSKLCKFVDEHILPQKAASSWEPADVEAGFKKLTDGAYTTTLFDSLFAKLETYEKLYQITYNIIINGKPYAYNINGPMIYLGVTYGLFRNEGGLCQAHNRIFEQKMYAYFLSRRQTNEGYPVTDLSGYIENRELDLAFTLQKFQEFMRENYAQRDITFLEREGRILFLSFLKPILNGKGHEFKEPVVGDERRTDLVLTLFEKRYVIEMKIWRGESYHQAGLLQLSDYLDAYGLKEGFLLIFDFRKTKEYKEEWIEVGAKRIFAVWV